MCCLLTSTQKVGKLAATLKMQTMAARAEKTSFALEPSCLAAIRIGCRGTHDIYSVPCMELCNYLSASSKGNTPSLKEMAAWLKAATVAQIDEFMATDVANQFSHMTAGPQDAVLIPFGWLSAERVGRLNDFFGFKLCILKAKDLDQLEVWNRHFIRQDQPNELIQQLIDHIALLE